MNEESRIPARFSGPGNRQQDRPKPGSGRRMIGGPPRIFSLWPPTTSTVTTSALLRRLSQPRRLEGQRFSVKQGGDGWVEARYEGGSRDKEGMHQPPARGGAPPPPRTIDQRRPLQGAPGDSRTRGFGDVTGQPCRRHCIISARRRAATFQALASWQDPLHRRNRISQGALVQAASS
jgi:hypothetical protein